MKIFEIRVLNADYYYDNWDGSYKTIAIVTNEKEAEEIEKNFCKKNKGNYEYYHNCSIIETEIVIKEVN